MLHSSINPLRTLHTLAELVKQSAAELVKQPAAELVKQSAAKQIKRSTARFILSTGLAIAGLNALPVHADTLAAQTAAAATPYALADGTYLYGQSQTAKQIGSAYMVFEVTQGKLLGAFYMPSSSFDCFYGNLEADRMALTVVDSYAQSPHPYAVALKSEAPVAMTGNGTIAPSITLEGFHRLESLSDDDQRILSTCKANYQSRI